MRDGGTEREIGRGGGGKGGGEGERGWEGRGQSGGGKGGQSSVRMREAVVSENERGSRQ